MLPIRRILAKHGIEHHAYADATQLFIKFKIYEPLDLQTKIEKMESCITDLKFWLPVTNSRSMIVRQNLWYYILKGLNINLMLLTVP